MTKPRAITLAAILAALAAAIFAAIAMLPSDGAPTTAPRAGVVSGAARTTAPAATPTADPYAVYLTTAPAGSVRLSREDAQTRALLGCGQTFAPGTIDAALAAAYRPTGICG